MALTDNLIAYWKLDESSGTTLVDSTSNGYDLGTSASGVTVGSTGKLGNAITLNGSTGSASRVYTSALYNASTFTIGMWIKRNSHSDKARNLFSSNATDSATWGDGYSFYLDSSNQLRYVNQFVADTTLGGNVNDTNWHYVLMTYNSGSVEGFVDGSSVGAGSAGTMNTSHAAGRTWIGENETAGGVGSGTNLFDGTIDEVGYWSRVLSGAEITSLYNSGSGLAYPFGASFLPRQQYFMRQAVNRASTY